MLELLPERACDFKTIGMSMQSKVADAANSGYVPYSDRNNLMVAEDVARLLRPDLPLERGLSWLREVTRRRKVNAMPCRNIGRHLVFDWQLVSEWIRNCPTHIVHSAHPPRRRKKLAKVA